MTRRLSLLVAAVAVAGYDIVAFRTRKVPTITHIVHVTRAHFKPHCEGCCCVAVRPLPPRRPASRGWHTSAPS